MLLSASPLIWCNSLFHSKSINFEWIVSTFTVDTVQTICKPPPPHLSMRPAHFVHLGKQCQCHSIPSWTSRNMNKEAFPTESPQQWLVEQKFTPARNLDDYTWPLLCELPKYQEYLEKIFPNEDMRMRFVMAIGLIMNRKPSEHSLLLILEQLERKNLTSPFKNLTPNRRNKKKGKCFHGSDW